jgi:hypothetical protein
VSDMLLAAYMKSKANALLPIPIVDVDDVG